MKASTKYALRTLGEICVILAVGVLIWTYVAWQVALFLPGGVASWAAAGLWEYRRLLKLEGGGA